MKQGARQKIMEAAEALARDVGPANLSLEAVARRAGVSKGGLLYHFPSKAKLLEALVEQYSNNFQTELDNRQKASGGEPDSLMTAYLEIFIAEHSRPPPTGVLAAFTENPELLVPLRRFKRQLLDRLKSSSSDEDSVLTVFLTLEGMSLLRLLGIDLLTSEEFDAVGRVLSTISRRKKKRAATGRSPPPLT